MNHCKHCTAPVFCRGYCPAHYQQWRRYGDPLATHPRGRSRGTWQHAFFAALADTGAPYRAAKTAGISRVRAYKLRREDPVFALQWEQALSCYQGKAV